MKINKIVYMGYPLSLIEFVLKISLLKFIFQILRHYTFLINTYLGLPLFYLSNRGEIKKLETLFTLANII